MRKLMVAVGACLTAACTAYGQTAPTTPGAPAAPACAAACAAQGCADPAPACWVDAGYLLWVFKKAPLPAPLATTDPTNGATATAGGLADPTTQVLIGGRALGPTTFSGGQLRAGAWLTDDIGVEAGAFLFGTNSTTSGVASDPTGNPFLFRPVNNVDTGNPNAGFLVAFPGAVSGNLVARSSTQLWGAEGLLAARLLAGGGLRLTALGGFRYLDLRDDLSVAGTSTDLAGIGSFGGAPTAPGDRATIVDLFGTRNQFYGGKLAARGEYLAGDWLVSATAGVSLGDTHQAVSVGGQTTLTPASGAAPTTLPGGLLALPSNSGRFTREAFSVVPELGGAVAWSPTPYLRLGVGYNFLYWNNVVRAGSQVNTTISAAQVPASPTYAPGTTAVPAPPHSTTDFWAHGVSFTAGLLF